MKRIINIHGLITLATIVSLLSACSKSFTDKIPANQTSPEVALGTEGAVGVALNGMYAQLRSTNLFGRSIPIVGDLMADNIYISSQNAGRYILQYTYSVIPADGFATGTWNDAYTGILRCNNIINDTLVKPSANMNEMQGEAYATRALLYFSLVNTYGKPYTDDPGSPGVPIVLVDSPYAEPTRNTVSQVFNQIVSDLKKAMSLCTIYTNSSQFSQFAAEGLLAKVYLYMGDYANAKASALDVINNGGFTLVTADKLAAYWASPEIRTDGIETLFEVSSDKQNNNSSDALSAMYDQTYGYGDMLCSTDLYNLYSSTDVRASWLQQGARGGGPAIFVNKYPNTGTTSNKDKTKVLRLSDVYLIAAETYQHSGENANALTYLNDIAGNRDPNYTGYASTVTGPALLDSIIQERRKELAFEGDRFYDLNRLKWAISRSTDYIPASVRNIAYGDTRRVAPIPLTQTQTDPNIKQNPGY